MFWKFFFSVSRYYFLVILDKKNDCFFRYEFFLFHSTCCLFFGFLTRGQCELVTLYLIISLSDLLNFQSQLFLKSKLSQLKVQTIFLDQDRPEKLSSQRSVFVAEVM